MRNRHTLNFYYFFFDPVNTYLTASWALQTTDGLVRKLEHELHAAQARMGLGRREMTGVFSEISCYSASRERERESERSKALTLRVHSGP